MTDPDLVRKRLAFIETCVHELRTLARPERMEFDVREERFVEHTLQLAIQAALDVASHIVSDERLGEPNSNHELFVLLAKAGLIQEEQSVVLRKMVGFRNLVVHGYLAVDLIVLRDIVEHRLGDLTSFVATIRTRIPDGT
jgi:uncharacterized protein YutE (UPF0331/DUF86 family)